MRYLHILTQLAKLAHCLALAFYWLSKTLND